MSKKEIFTALVYICLYSVLFVPFSVVESLYFPFITGKTFLFFACVQIATLSWLILCGYNKEVRPKRGLLLWTTLIFLAIVAVADITAIEPQVSIWGNFERMDGLMTIIHVVLFFIVMSSMLQNHLKKWVPYFITSLVASTITCVMVFRQAGEIAQTGASIIRAEVTFGNPIYVAAYLLIHIFIVGWFFVRHRGMKARIGLGALALVHVIALYFTGTRGAFVGLAVGALVTSIYVAIRERKDPFLRWGATALVALAVVGGGLFFSFKDSSFIQNSPSLSRIANSSLTEGTGYSRWILWTSVAPEGIKERPILGWGQGGFAYVFDKYYDPRLHAQEDWFDRSHNILIDWMIAAGIVGFLSYISIFIGAGICVVRNKEFHVTEKAILIGMMVAYLVQNIFVFDSLTNYIFFFTLLAYIHGRSSEDSKVLWVPKQYTTLVTIVGVCCMIALFYFATFRPYTSAYSLRQAINLHKQDPQGNVFLYYDSLDVNYNLFDKAFRYGRQTGEPEVAQRMLSVAGNISHIQNIDQATKDKFLDRSFAEMKQLAEENPRRAIYPMLIGLRYADIGQHDQALAYYEKALQNTPNKQKMMQLYATTLINLDRLEEARDMFKKAYELDTTNDIGWVNYMQSVFLMEDFDFLDAEVEKVRQTNTERLVLWYKIQDQNNVLTAEERVEYEALLQE